MRVASILKTVGAVGVLAAMSCTGDELQDTTCNPGDNIFCRCRGGAAGTKKCLEDGESFGPCESVSGTCDEAPTGTGGSGGGTVPGGGDKPLPEAGELLAVCTTDAECNAGTTCPMGYCTKPCQSYEECAPPEPAEPGDCVMILGAAQCMPYCITEQSCAPYGENSHCSYTDESLPPFDVVVCADWGDQIYLPPDEYPPGEGVICPDDSMCNLGWDGTERVCHGGSCTDGCHQDPHCSEQTWTCSSSTVDVLGSCVDPGGVLGDGCPGEPVSLSLSPGQDTVQLIGDTASMPLPAELRGEGNCVGSGNDDGTEEQVYAVTPQDSGTLWISVEPDVDFDSMVYVRGGSCASGQQLECADEPGPGQVELFTVPVTAYDQVYVVVDGWDTSTGVFIIDFLLEP